MKSTAWPQKKELKFKTPWILVDGTFYVLRRSLWIFMTYVGCLNVIGHQMTSLVYSYPPLSFFETPLPFLDDQRRVEKEKPVERFRTFHRVKHVNTALQSKSSRAFSSYQSSNYTSQSCFTWEFGKSLVP